MRSQSLAFHGVARNHPASAAADDLVEGEVIQQVLLVHAAGGHKLHIDIRRGDGLDVLQAASRLSREELHGLQTQRKRDLDIARVRRAGADRDADLLAVLDGGRVQTRGDDELRAGGHRAIHLLAGEHGARADDHIRERFGHVLDRVRRGGGAEGDLRARQAAVNQRLRKRHGVRRVVDGDNRHNADSGKLLHHIHIVFPPSEYSECIYAICRPKAAKGCVISERNPRASG